MAAVTAAVVGIASAGVGAVQGFSAASRAKRDAAAASEAASKAMKSAKAKAETDFYEGLAVPLDSYEAEFENNLAVAQQSTEALQEGDARALAAGVGRVGATSADQAEQTRIAMGKDISELDQMKATSKDAINQQLIEMDVAEAKQQNQIAAESKAAQAAGISQGIQGIAGVVGGIGSMAKLYPGGGKPGAATTAKPDMKMKVPEGTSASGAPLTVPVMTPTGSMFDIPGAGDYSGGFNSFTPPVNPYS